MKTVTRFVRKWWWLFVAVASGLFLLFWRLAAMRRGEVVTPPPVPRMAERAREEVERIHLEGEVEKAKVKTESAVAVAEIERIEDLGKTDPKAARKQLSSWLTKNL